MICNREPAYIITNGIKCLAAILVMAGFGIAAGADTLPSTLNSTTLTATVSEQATISVPANVTFTVTNVAVTTAAASGTISCTNIVLNNTKALRMSLQANAAAFTPPAGGSVTWSASDVTWDVGSWGAGPTGSAGTLSSAAFGTVVQTAANAASVTGSCTFTLAAKAVDRAGNHTLAMTWKVESL
jgi:hypothetical protein